MDNSLTTSQTPSRLVISSRFLQSPSSRLTLVCTKWPATVVEVAAAVAGEVVAAVAEAVADVVVCATSPFDNERVLTPIPGWTGGNSDPVRNSRW